MAITLALVFILLITSGCAGGRDRSSDGVPDSSYASGENGGDSVERHRALTDSLRGEKSLYRKYVIASDNASFFEREGMTLELGLNYEQLGNVMAQIGDTAKAKGYYRLADKCFREAGTAENLCTNLMHSTNAMDNPEAAATFRRLLADTTVKRNPGLTADCLEGMYLKTDSLQYLDSCLSVIERHPGIADRELSFLLSCKGEELLVAGDLAGAKSLTGRIKASEKKERPEARRREFIHTILAHTYFGAGMKDSCIQELLNVIFWTDSAYREANLPEIYARDTRRLIAVTERNASLEKRDMALWWAVTALGLLSVAIYIYYRAKRRQAASRHEIELLDSRLESVTHSHNAQSAVMEGNTRLIEELREAVERHGKDGADDGKLGTEVTRILNIYSGGEESRKGFLTVSREVNPRFSGRLKADYPALSESQLRLAALIATGIDGQQLATILNISYKSLYTGRYRLRSQLGLTKNDSLEDFLRKYNS